MQYLAGAIALVVAAAAAILAAAETSVMLLSPGRVHRLVETERRGAVALDSLSDVRHRLRATSALCGGFAFAVAGAVGVQLGVDFVVSLASTELPPTAAQSLGALAGLVLLGLLAHAFTQALPRTLAAQNPERVGLAAARVAWPMTVVFYPLAKVLGAPWKWVVSLTATERPTSAWAVTPDWLGAKADEDDERQGAEEALLEAVSDFGEKIAREVMVPRTDMKALPDSALVEDAIAMISETGYTRVPVFHQTIDDIRGIVYAKDLLGVAAKRPGARIIEYARVPHFVPETKPVEELLVEMRTKTHIAIVADEYGGTSGLVTLEDLLEEIVGEISDEYDLVEELITDLGEGRFRMDARLPVDDLNETFATDIDTEVDSVGGLFTEVLGRIPQVGEAVEIEGLRLTVTDLEGTRIRRLCVEPAPPADGGSNDA